MRSSSSTSVSVLGRFGWLAEFVSSAERLRLRAVVARGGEDGSSVRSTILFRARRVRREGAIASISLLNRSSMSP